MLALLDEMNGKAVFIHFRLIPHPVCLQTSVHLLLTISSYHFIQTRLKTHPCLPHHVILHCHEL